MPRAAWKARAARPDLVLRNFDLPDVNGRGIVLSPRRQPPPDGLPIIAGTVQADEDSITLAEGFGCNAFLAKPFLPDDLPTLGAHLLDNQSMKGRPPEVV